VFCGFLFKCRVWQLGEIAPEKASGKGKNNFNLAAFSARESGAKVLAEIGCL